MVAIQYHYEAAAPDWPQTMDIGPPPPHSHTTLYEATATQPRSERVVVPQPRRPLYEAACMRPGEAYFNDAGRLHFTRWQNIALGSFGRLGAVFSGRTVPKEDRSVRSVSASARRQRRG